jgi:hypothetical protein
MQAHKPQSTIRRGKLVIDVESQKYEFSDLSIDTTVPLHSRPNASPFCRPL